MVLSVLTVVLAFEVENENENENETNTRFLPREIHVILVERVLIFHAATVSVQNNLKDCMA